MRQQIIRLLPSRILTWRNIFGLFVLLKSILESTNSKIIFKGAPQSALWERNLDFLLLGAVYVSKCFILFYIKYNASSMWYIKSIVCIYILILFWILDVAFRNFCFSTVLNTTAKPLSVSNCPCLLLKVYLSLNNIRNIFPPSGWLGNF